MSAPSNRTSQNFPQSQSSSINQSPVLPNKLNHVSKGEGIKLFDFKFIKFLFTNKCSKCIWPVSRRLCWATRCWVGAREWNFEQLGIGQLEFPQPARRPHYGRPPPQHTLTPEGYPLTNTPAVHSLFKVNDKSMGKKLYWNFQKKVFINFLPFLRLLAFLSL